MIKDKKIKPLSYIFFLTIILAIGIGKVITHPAFFVRDYILTHGVTAQGQITEIIHNPKSGFIAMIKYKDQSGAEYNAAYPIVGIDPEYINKKLDTGSTYPVSLHFLKNYPGVLVVDDLTPDIGVAIVCGLLATLSLAGIVGTLYRLFRPKVFPKN